MKELKRFAHSSDLKEGSCAGKMMKAAVFAGAEAIDFLETSIPQPEAGQVRIRIEGCGVCASNLPVWEGRPWFHYPIEAGAPGHEAWGWIDAVGPGVHHLEAGRRVTFLSERAFAEYEVVPASVVVPLPEVLDGLAFPGEPLGCAINVFRRSEIEPGQTVAIVGIGFLGALLTALCVGAGAHVLSIDRRPYALNIAAGLGAGETILMDDHVKIIDRVNKLTKGNGCPRVIEAVGQQWPLDLAGELAAVRGRLIIAGYHQDGPRQVNMQLWNWRGLDVINAHERDQEVYVRGMREAVDATAKGRLSFHALCTHSFKLRELSEAFSLMRSRPDGFLKALIFI